MPDTYRAADGRRLSTVPCGAEQRGPGCLVESERGGRRWPKCTRPAGHDGRHEDYDAHIRWPDDA